MVLSTLVRRHDKSFVIHLLELAINPCLYDDLCNLGVQSNMADFDLPQKFPVSLMR